MFKSQNAITSILIKMTCALLKRYQQLIFYILGIPLLISIPKIIGYGSTPNEIIVLSHYNFLLWIYSQFLLNQFALSAPDIRSFIIFPVNWYQFIVARNIVFIMILLLSYTLTFILIVFLYQLESISPLRFLFFNIMSLIPIISISNMLSVKALQSQKDILFSWKSILIILIANMNLTILVTGNMILKEITFYGGLFPLVLIYIYLYKVSLDKSTSRLIQNYKTIMEIQYE